MAHRVELQTVEPLPLAVARYQTTLTELPLKVGAYLSPVWDYVRREGIPTTGQNVLFYPGGGPAPYFPIEAGILLTAPIAGEGEIVASSTPGGLVATTTHIGPYDRLDDAHAAIFAWCGANSRTLAGPSWELYGHWEDDPAKLRTDVYYLLRS